MSDPASLAMNIQIIAEVGKQTAPEPAVKARFRRIEESALALRKLLEERDSDSDL